MFTLRLVLVACCVGTFVANQGFAQRSFAPGVVKVIPPVINGRDVHSLPMPLPGLDAVEYTPNTLPKNKTLYGQTRDVIFHRDVFQHEFAFLGLRQLNVPASNLVGQARNRNIWYMVFRIRNVGAYISHERVEDPKFGHVDFEPKTWSDDVDPAILSNRFFGRFVLSGWVQDPNTGMYTEQTYHDQVSPALTRVIQNEEDPDQPLLDKIQLARKIFERYPADSDQGGTWGVVMWYNVDPSLDFVSVKIGGLTNAYRMEVNPDGSIDFRNKMLQLNFWRPGDGIDQSDDPVVYGISLTDNPLKQVEIARRYHLPGPVIRGEIVDQETLRSSLIFEADAAVDDIDFDSAVAAELDSGQIPPTIVEAFANAGQPLDSAATVNTTIPGRQWAISYKIGENETRDYVIKLKPEFWEKSINGGIQFIKRLDHLWIYE